MRPERRQKGINRAKAVLRIWDACSVFEGSHMEAFDKGDKYAKAMIHTRKPCGGFCCANARRFEGKTIQELKADDSFAQQLGEEEAA